VLLCSTIAASQRPATLRRLNDCMITPLAIGERSIVVSVSVCLSVRDHISATTCPSFCKFLCMFAWLGCDTLCTSGFMDELYLHIMDRTGHIDRVTSLRHRAQVIAPLLRRIGCGYLAVVCHVLDDGVRHCANDAGRRGRSLHWRRNRPRRSKTRYSTVGPTIARSPV